ncbi:shikimate kinase [Pseudozobellia thermophila]|uniref:Shikimate kinase n=1 Tax=Pseudozobellia thermophila TaxID=192903 RepID=A0A1M6I7X1_9FLAO|nr:shikimate kinase [Pseudozobellia thermophila]SHJ30495.1 shikimate kinase [Pseudozobellia thermophila]
MKIVLLGYMGSGKSTIGKLLAQNMKLQFLDLDDCIEEGEGMDIPEIFKSKGELYFRKREFHYLEEVLNGKDNFVLSTGGGTPCYGKNMETILGATNNVVYLKVSIPGLVARLSKEKSERPLIRDIPDEELPEFIGKHLFERNAFYNRAHCIVVGDNKTPDEIALEIEGSIL